VENSGAMLLFSRLPNRRRPRISAENAMSFADNFIQKQQKQQYNLELWSGRPFCASCECVEAPALARSGQPEYQMSDRSWEVTNMAETNTDVPTEAVSPSGINHLVLNVRDIEESHKFWTEIVGFKQVGELHSRHDRPLPPKMRFYSAVNDGKLTHHTVALVESANLPPPAEWQLVNSQVAINHVALTMPNREAWLKQLKFLQSRGVKFNWRVNHGVTHSVYINDPNGYGVEFLYEMPREMWENDIDAGINWLENLPSEGPEALVDRTDTPSFGQKQPAAAPAE
jgi:catechol 2,3-dioxygenase